MLRHMIFRKQMNIQTILIVGCISVLFACSKASDAEILAVDITPSGRLQIR